MKKGFTIVELLVVIAIIGVLVGIVSVAANGALRNGRTKRANAMCTVLQQALAAYNAQMGRWPQKIESKIGNLGDKTSWTFIGSDADEIFREIVKASVGSRASMPLVDASALFVADSQRLKNGGEGCYDNHVDKQSTSFCGDQHCVGGVDFSIASNKKGKNRIPLDRMAFGYQGTASGKFCRFWITYNARTDAVTVSRKNPDKTYPESWE